eukprot:CAMPEP_0182417394 /NCGR_PEP_ID=MMETSP1167-20130531/1855_1 /TAXON_ID=2988 /ORGANISM="Mallomonas Sp, Strain CCMP3275" /LENGTH=830 /DNA_ID=CAMNT_0024590927 /DNA_START=105 /DNA_END=2597 /DNA_ORIENTATION=+
MSVVGIDYGNQSALIAQAAKGGIDVILNDASHRQTATVVSIQGKQRFIGDAGASMARSNVKNTVSCMKMLVGRKFDEPEVQRELARAPFKCCKLEHGGVGICVSYNDEDIYVSAEHFMAMMLVKAKDIAKKANNNIGIGDAVLAVPYWFTEPQRRGVLNACEIADLHCLEITNESTAIATSYGIYKSAKKLFSETDPTFVMFIDIGYSCYSVTIVSFIQEKLEVCATVCHRDLGGRDFDNIIMEMMAVEFEKRTKINVRGNMKAMLKMQVAAEKAKKTLSPHGVSEANVSVECLAEDTDLSCVITRDEFEARAAPLLNRLADPIERCLAQAGLSKEQISETEIVGGSCRINAVKKMIGQVLGLDHTAMNYGLKTTMNFDEAVARGSALMCAMQSSRVMVKKFQVRDRLPYDVSISYEAGPTAKGEGKDDEEEEDAVDTGASGGAGQGPVELVLFPKGEQVPRDSKRVTFLKKSESFTVTAKYSAASAQDLPPGFDLTLASYFVKIPSEYGGKNNKVRLSFSIDKNSCLQLNFAELLDPLPPAPAAEGKESKDDESSKKKFKKVQLQTETICFGLTKDQIKASILQESLMQSEDDLIVETANKRNELEAYIYSMRDKVDGSLKEYRTNSEKSQLQELLVAAEDWLYNEGFEATKLQYARKLDELKALGSKLEMRQYEESNRQQACDGMRRQVELCKSFSTLKDDDHAHISDEERSTVRAAAENAESWLFDELEKQGSLLSYNDPVLTVDNISKKRQTLYMETNTIMSKPKPKPKAPEKEESKGGSTKESDQKKGDSSKEGQPMDEEKGEGKESSGKEAGSKDNASEPMEQE